MLHACSTFIVLCQFVQIYNKIMGPQYPKNEWMEFDKILHMN